MIRKAEIKDIDSIMVLLNEVLVIHNKIRGDIFKPTGSKYTKEELISIIENPITPVYVYEENGVVLGHLFCNIKEITETNNKYALKELFIDDLCVKSEYRGRKIGKSLYEYIKKYASSNGFTSIVLNCWEGNDAFDFYSHIGLKTRSRILEEKL